MTTTANKPELAQGARGDGSATPPPQRRRRRHVRVSRILMHTTLIVIGMVFAFPFYWMIVMSTSTTNQIFAVVPRLIPGPDFFRNFDQVLSSIPFARAFINSAIVTLIASFFQVGLAALAGFTFAKYRFPGRDRLFSVLLATMVLPTGVSLVPNFQIYTDLHWINTFYPLIVPGAVTAFAVFWIRQAAVGAVQNETIEAARVDGAGFWRIFWSVGIPALRPTLAGLAIFQVMWNWNDYLWPLLVLNDSSKYTLPVALAQLKGAYGATDYSVVMSGTLVATIPLVILFLIFRRQVMDNVVAGAVKG